MKTEIVCDKELIRDVFSHWYSIPNYQRPYVWETQQVEELLECIENAMANQDKQYFIGSIVYKTNQINEGGVSYDECELLDGQQRITTIFLIIATIRDIVSEYKDEFVNSNKIITTCEQLIWQEPNEFMGIPERMRIVFDIRKDVKEFVNSYVRITGKTADEESLQNTLKDKTANTSIKNIANTILTIRNFFKEEQVKGSNTKPKIKTKVVQDFLMYMLNNVLLVYVATENLQDAFQLFTVMNNTGVKLRNSDILKALNLKEITSDDRQTDCAMEWEEMESYFGNSVNEFDNFLSQIRTIIVKRRADYTLIEEFKNIYSGKRWNRSKKQWEYGEPILKKGADTFAFLKEYFNAYQNVFDKSHFDESGSYAIFNYLSFMSKAFETDYWKAPVLMYFKKFGYKGFGEFLKKLDNKLSCDWITGLIASMRIDNMNQILVCIENTQDYCNVLSSGVFNVNINDFKNVISDNIYGRRYARYLLLKIDLLNESTSEKYDLPETISIEHILPQNPNNASQWRADFSDEEREEWTDKIGNLVLISKRKNTAQGNRDFAAKKDKYFKSNIERFPSMLKLFNENTEWKLANVQKRQNEVVEKLLRYYEL